MKTRTTKAGLAREAEALKALAALAQAQRLRAFRALVVAGDAGMTAGSLAAALDAAPSALSFHLKELSGAALITSEARGRFIVYRASFTRMNALMTYLSEHCCQGVACEAGAVATCPAC